MNNNKKADEICLALLLAPPLPFLVSPGEKKFRWTHADKTVVYSQKMWCMENKEEDEKNEDKSVPGFLEFTVI